MSETKINYVDYVGFTYNGVHSSELGIVRVSDGSRFNENLLPTMQDKTVQVPGGDGTYYFGSYYTQKQFNVSFAFDSLTEEQVARIKTVFGDKGIHDLIFDELPYKVWSAKVTGSSTLKYIPFTEGNTNRLYKGEGSIQFTCYKPYARSRYKTLEEYKCSNIQEWSAASGLIETKDGFKKYLYPTVDFKKKATTFCLYNPGGIPSDFKVWIGPNTSNTDTNHTAGEIKMEIEGVGFLTWRPFKLTGKNVVIIDTSTNLFEEYADCSPGKLGPKTGKIYNDHIIDGDFFKIPITSKTQIKDTKLQFTNIALADSEYSLQYDYYYF